MQRPNTFGKRVWAGDSSTVAEARKRYEHDQQKELLSFAVVLYSFRADRRYAAELIDLRPKLIRYWLDYRTGSDHDDTDEVRAITADILSTHLEWLSRRSELTPDERNKTQEIATAVYEYGIGFATDPSPLHTRCLLELTAARLFLAMDIHWRFRYSLRSAAHVAPKIKNANQRARVYRKLGSLYRKGSRFVLAAYWGVRACLVPGIPMAVRMKSVAALAGIDR